MLRVKLVNGVDDVALHRGRAPGRVGKVEDGLAARTKDGSLVSGWHEAARPVGRSADRAASRIEHDDVAGQVLVHRPKPIG